MDKTQVKLEPNVKLEAFEGSQYIMKPEKTNIKEEFSVNIKIEPYDHKKPAKTKPSSSKKDIQSNKNIIKNYARAMVNFALSSLSAPYLGKVLEKEKDLNLKEFRAFMQEQKEEINSIKNLRELLLIKEGESHKIASYKRIFQAMCVIFVKFFAVNWIYNSKVCDKLTHLKYRYKILRRIRNPELFTYLENFNKTK